jgi:hypothetical protein
MIESLFRATTALFAVLAVLAAPGCGGQRDSNTGWDSSTADGTDVHVDVTDTDGDTISDHDEGRGAAIDSDGDTVPDYRDDDSDDDGIPDFNEAGDSNAATPPVDSDADGDEDFRDPDSDNNGLLDLAEGMGDQDGNGVPDFADPDNDGDGIDDVEEMQGNPAGAPDSDGDTIPDYNDVDSDGDTIGDQHEQVIDTDSDLIPDYLDLDTDSDTISDADEAGDADVSTPPRDTDGDYTPDFRDPDSDNDGLSDLWETENGTDPYVTDTDGDGTSDLIEVGAETDPNDPADDPRVRGNFVFKVPYNDPDDLPDPPLEPEPTVDHLVFSTDLQMADVYFTLDSSGSMRDEIDNLRESLEDVVVPGVAAEIPDVWFGVGRFEDCDPGSCSNDMRMLQAVTSDIPTVRSAIASMTTTCGGAEPYTQNLCAIATGNVTPYIHWNGVGPVTPPCSPPGSIGWPCFRPGAVPIVVQLGDEDFDEATGDCSPGKSHADAIAALNSISAKYIGVDSGSSDSDMETIANGTGSVDTSGSPLVFSIPGNGSGLDSQVVNAIGVLANQVPIEVTTDARDDPSDSVDTVVEFIDYIEPSTAGGWEDPADPSRVCVGGLDVADLYDPFDGRPDSFTGVLPGTIVCFDIYPKRNESVPATDSPQTFLCEIDVIGDGITVLDTREVYFLVPPVIEIDIPS